VTTMAKDGQMVQVKGRGRGKEQRVIRSHSDVIFTGGSGGKQRTFVRILFGIVTESTEKGTEVTEGGGWTRS
jgi:hypothetical protein